MSNWWESSPVAEEKTDATPAANWWDEHPTEGDQGAPKKQNTSLIGDIGTGLKRGALQIPSIATGLGDIVSAPLAAASGVRKPISKAVDWLGEKTGFQPGKWAEEATAEYSPEMQQAIAHVDEAQGFFPALKAAVEKPRSIANLVAESLPSTLVGGVAARGAMGAVMGAERLAATRIAAAAGDKAAKAALLKSGSIAGGIGEGAVTAGQQMEQTDASVDPLRAAGSAIGSGIGTGIIGAAGGRFATKLGLPDVDTAFAAGTLGDGVQAGTTLAAKAANVGKRMAIGGVQEGVFEEMPQSAQEQVWQNVANGKPWDEGVGEAMAQGLIAGTAMGAGVNALPRGTAAEPQPTPEAEPIDGTIPESAGLPGEQLLQTEAPANTEAFEKTKLPAAGPLSAAVNAGIDSGATSLDPVAPTSSVLRERDFVPPPSGNFGQMNEFADLLNSERQDVEGQRQKIATTQQLRRDSAMETTDARVEAQRLKETAQKRDALLANVLDNLPEGQNPKRAFDRALRSLGFTNLEFRPEETARINHWQGISQNAESDTIPAAPNELDAAAMGIRERRVETPEEIRQRAIAENRNKLERTRQKIAAQRKGQSNGGIPASPINAEVVTPSLEVGRGELSGSGTVLASAPVGDSIGTGNRAEVAQSSVRPAVAAGSAGAPSLNINPQGIDNGAQANQTIESQTQRTETQPAAAVAPESVTRTESGAVAVKGYSADRVRSAAKNLGYRVIVGANGNAVFPYDSDIKKIKKELGFAEIKAAPRTAEKAPEPAGMFVGNRAIGKGHTADEEVTIKDGIVHIGKYAAVDYETGEEVRVPDGSSPADVRDALQRAGAIEPGLNFYGAPGETKAERDDAKEFNELYQHESADLAERRAAKAGKQKEDADVPEANFGNMPETQQQQALPEPPARRPVKPKAAPIMRRDDLVGAIMRATGGRGIHSNMATTLIGDTANNATRVRGLFTNQGQQDMDDLAMLLREQEGFDVRDASHLEDLVREAAAGNVAKSMERQEREKQEAAEKEHRDNVRQKAKRYGIKTVARKFEDITKDVAAHEMAEQQQAEDEAILEREAIQAAASEEVSDETINELARLAADHEGRYINEEWISNDEILDAFESIGEGSEEQTPAGAGETVAAETGGNNQERSQEARPDLALEGQTPAEVRAQEAQRRAEEEAANKPAPDTSPRVKADQPDIFNTQSALFNNNRETPAEPKKQKSIPELQAELKKADQFSQISGDLNGKLIERVTEDAQQAIDSGIAPTYGTGQGTFVVVHPSAQNEGMIQVTRYSERGVFGDSQYNTLEQAVSDNVLWTQSRMTQDEADAALKQSLEAEAEYQRKREEAERPKTLAERIAANRAKKAAENAERAKKFADLVAKRRAEKTKDSQGKYRIKEEMTEAGPLFHIVATGDNGSTAYVGRSHASREMAERALQKLAPDESTNPEKLDTSAERGKETAKNQAVTQEETAADRVPATIEKAETDMTPDWDSFAEFWNGLIDGKGTIADVKKSFELLIEEADTFRATIAKMKNDQLKRMVGWSARPDDKKADLVRKVYESTLDRFTLNKSAPSKQWTYGEKMEVVEKRYQDQLRAIIDGLTDADLTEFRESIAEGKRARKESLEQKKAAAADPKTIEDFEVYATYTKNTGKTADEARKALTPEQRALWDSLLSEKSRTARQNSSASQKADVKVAAVTTEGQIVETKHTRTGEDLFVVKAAERVDRDVYNQWNVTAKRLGGWYSSFRGNGAVPGFQFKTRENASAFLKFLGGDVAEAKEVVQERRDAYADDRSQTAVERLTEMADRLGERADESLGRERKANTDRRARFAAAAENAAQSDKALSKTMRNIAESIQNGTAKLLDRVRQKSQVEMLQEFIRNAKDAELRAKYPAYIDQELHKGEAPSVDTPEFAQWPSYTADRSDLANLARQLLETEGTKKLGQQLLKIADDVTAEYKKFAKENLHKVSVFSAGREGSDERQSAVFQTEEAAERAISRSGFKGKATTISFKRGEHLVIMGPTMARERGVWPGDDNKRISLAPDSGGVLVEKLGKMARTNRDAPRIPWQFENAYDKRKRLAAMGIETPAEFRAALREFIGLREQAKAPDRIKELERSMIGRKNDGLDFFPTPKNVAQQMIDAAELKEGMSVLEPSAGWGHIAEQVRDAGVDPDVVELSNDRKELLEAKGFRVVGRDFMELSPRGFTYGDVFRAKDGTVGVMRGSGGMGSNRVGLQPLDENGQPDSRRSVWVDRDELVEVEKRGTDSGYDRILMNPPFSDRRDAQHVQHAYSLLRPGGRLVAIMGEGVFFGQDKKADSFRNWIEEVGGTSEQLEEGSFLDPSLPVNTGVNARLVVIDKPAGKADQTDNAVGNKANDGRITPADKTIYGMAAEGKSASDILKFIADTSRNPFYRQLARLLQKTGIAPKIVVGTSDGWKFNAGEGKYAAAYNPKTDTVALFRPASSERNMLHELIHAATLKALSKRGMAAVQMKKLFEHVAKSGKLKGMYGMANVDEFVAEAFSNPKFQEALKKVDSPAASNGLSGAWHWFVRIVRGILGVPQGQDNALSAALEIGVGVMQDNMKMTGEGTGPARFAQGAGRVSPIDTPEFKAWFGDSKVVDADGKPLVVYHGTASDITAFDINRSGESTGNTGFYGAGAYFSEDADYASGFSFWARRSDDQAPNVVPVYLSLKNPAYINITPRSQAASEKSRATAEKIISTMIARGTDKAVVDKLQGFVSENKFEPFMGTLYNALGGGTGTTALLKEAGFDGVTIYGGISGKEKLAEAVAFDPTQIKSSIGNNGDFDPSNPDIRYNIIGDSGRQYDAKHRAFFKNVGRDVNRQNVIEKTLDYLKSDFWKKMAVGIVDQFRGLRDLNDGGQAYLLARLSKGTAGAFDTLLHHGKISLKDGVYDGDTSGGFVERLGVPLNGELDDFLWWVAANRAEKLTADGKENLFSPTDIQAGKSLAAGLTTFDYTIQTGQSKGTTTRNRQVIYQDALRVFNEFQKNVLDLSEQSGLIDGNSRKHWESEFYVPFYRVSEEDGEFVGAKMGNALVRQQAFKKLKGGTDKLNSDLLTNTLMNMSHLIEASAKNRAARAALSAAENMGAAQRVAPDMASYAASNGAMLPPGTKKTVWFQQNGKKVEYLVSDPFVMTAITSLEYAGMRNGVMDAMTKFKHLLTIGVTASPAFKVRNLIRDSIQAIGTSDLGYNPIKNVVDGFKQTNRESQAYVSALASGGLIRFGTMLEGSESSRVRQLIKAGVKDSSILNNEAKWRQFYDKYVDPAVSAYNELGNRSEEINRAALYNQLIKQGKSHGEAALLARDLMDFGMMGSFNTIRFLGQVVPFFNARLQGMYKLGRSAKDNPKKLAVVTGAVAVASIALMLGYEDDEDWKRREDWDRDGFWWFKFGGVEYRIPKPFEVGAVASLAERSVEYLINDEMTGERFRKVVGALAMNNLSMNPVPQMVKPMIDLYANRDSFTGRPIESMSMERLEKTMRFNSNTSMPARALSNATLGALSPVQYDHLARAYFGWLGAFAVGGADMAYRAVSDEPTQPALDYFKFFSQGIMKEEGTGSSRYLSNLYDQASELETVYSTYRQLLKDGKGEEASEYAEDNADALRRYKSVEAIKKVQTKMNQNIRAIERDPEMDSDEKKIRIDRIQKMKEQFAKRISPGA